MERNRGGTHAILLFVALLRGFDEFRVVRQPEIIVRAKVERILSVN